LALATDRCRLSIIDGAGGLMGTPTPPWNGLFENIQKQGFNSPLSPSGRYAAFLSKADLDEAKNTYDLFFELVPLEWAAAALFGGDVDVRAPAPPGPATVYHVRDADRDTVVKLLGVTSTDWVAEGSWYVITLTKSDTGVVGDLYDPDIDMTVTEPPRG
jgi:hypothetical protein